MGRQVAAPWGHGSAGDRVSPWRARSACRAAATEALAEAPAKARLEVPEADEDLLSPRKLSLFAPSREAVSLARPANFAPSLPTCAPAGAWASPSDRCSLAGPASLSRHAAEHAVDSRRVGVPGKSNVAARARDPSGDDDEEESYPHAHTLMLLYSCLKQLI